METVAASLGALTVADEAVGFSSLPDEVGKKIFSGLPVDTRLRSREVSPVWCALLEDVSLWQSLDFSEAAAKRLTVALTWGLVRAACARAKGTLHTLDLESMRDVPRATLIELLAENGESLRSLITPEALVLSAADVGRLRQAAPMCKLDCAVQCTGAGAVALLRCELLCPFCMYVFNLDTQQQTDFAAALASRTEIVTLNLYNGNLAGGAALVDLARAIVTADVRQVSIQFCELTPMALPALTLLIRSNVLRTFSVANTGVAFFTGPDLFAFCDTLRSNSGLSMIHIVGCNLWADPAAAGMVLAALAARTTPFKLWMDINYAVAMQAQQRAVGTQLAQLITARRIDDLTLSGFNLGEAGLAPIFAALSVATRLKRLHLIVEEKPSRKFARDVVLPAVRANTSLRCFSFFVCGGKGLPPKLVEAQDIVAARR